MGTGMNHTVEVRVLNGNLSSVYEGTDVKFEYEAPRINKKEIEGAKSGGYYINVTGITLGPTAQNLLYSRWRRCLATKRVSQSLVQCLVPPGAGRKKIDIIVLGRNVFKKDLPYTHRQS